MSDSGDQDRKYILSEMSLEEYTAIVKKNKDQKNKDQKNKDQKDLDVKKSAINLWASFLKNEKLNPMVLEEKDVLNLIKLCEEAGKERGPIISQHKDKLISREFICGKAMDLGIDLTSIKLRGKIAMGRGLLDAWNKLYKKRFESVVGTVGAKEATRRDVKTKLCKQGIKGVRRNYK